MKKKILVYVAIILALVGLVFLVAFRTEPYDNINPDVVAEPSEITGNIAEKIIGDPETAKFVVFEYADFGCSHCAEWNKKMNKIIEDSNGEVALIFRTYNIGFANGPAAARAATAAQIQGYFKEYKDLLFDNQTEWFYEEGAKLEDIFVKYFEKASGGAGDVDKFEEDMKSAAVKTRLKFEQNMGKKVNISGTPTFRIDGTTIELGELDKKFE